MVSVQDAETSTLRRLSDDDDDEPSSESEAYEEGDLLSAAMDDDVTAQLAAAGWQIKHINGDFPFFSLFHFFVYSLLTTFIYGSSTTCRMRYYPARVLFSIMANLPAR